VTSQSKKFRTANTNKEEAIGIPKQSAGFSHCFHVLSGFLVLKTGHLDLNSPDFWIPASVKQFRLTRSEGGPIIDLFWQPSRSLPMLKSYRMVEVQVMR
jgi:hypothetical protein